MGPRVLIALFCVLPVPPFVDDSLERGLEVGGDRGGALAARLEDDAGRRVWHEDHCRLARLSFKRLADVCGDVEELGLVLGREGESPHRGVQRTRLRLTFYARGVPKTGVRAGGQTKFLLEESQLPRRWYNIRSDMPTAPQPVLHPGTGQPVGPDDLAPLFPMELIGQEVSEEAEIAIPEEVLEIYSLWRPTPLFRARRLEEAIGTRSRIFYKYEGVSPPGSHKPNTAVAQAFYNKREGRTRLSTETGAGQWGSALAFACKLIGLECKVYMVKISYEQKPSRRSLIQAWGAEIVPSPSEETESGRAIVGEHPDSPGSLGIAISEAVEDAAGREDTAYSLGSVLNHVLLHQTVIGQEALAQMELADAFPDVVIGCVGGGSNFAGLAFPFLREKIAGREIDVLACEPAACPTLTRGLFAYDFGDTSKLTPLVPMHTLGHDFVPAPIHAGGLRYHGVAPLISQLLRDGLIRAEAYLQNDVFGSAVLFAGSEGILPAPEAAHAIHGALQAAKAADDMGEERTILFNLSGHGHFDMAAYDNYFAGKLEDVALDEDEMSRALQAIEGLPSPA
jgi:tryptophan synthase beta chain